METDTDHVIRALSRRQLGLFTRDQALSEGISARALRHRVEAGMLDRVSDTVFRLAGTPVGPRSHVMTAVLDAGPSACASHWTAAALWGLPGGLLLPTHVIAARATIRTTPYMALIHQPRSVLSPHLASRFAIPVTTPARIVFDIAGLRGVHPLRIEHLVDTVLARNLATVARLDRTLDALAARGRRGIALMRGLIASRRGDYRPTESGLEFRFQELARRAGMSDFVRQLDVGDDDDWIGRVDFVDRGRRIIVETDTFLHHGSVTDREHDALRRDRLRALGWVVLAVTDVDVFHRSDQLVRDLRTLRRLPAELAS